MTSELLVRRPVRRVRVTDPVTGEPPAGLRATALTPRGPRAMVAGRHGFALHALPEVPVTGAVVVEDPHGRFLPATTTGDVLVLPSAPSRPAPASHAAIRATVLRRATGAPAAGARLDAECGDRTTSGFCDARGEVLVLLPWPAPRSGLAAARRPWPAQRWEVVLRAHVPSGAPLPVDPAAPREAKRVFARATGQAALGPLELRPGHELVATSGEDTHLLIA